MRALCHLCCFMRWAFGVESVHIYATRATGETRPRQQRRRIRVCPWVNTRTLWPPTGLARAGRNVVHDNSNCVEQALHHSSTSVLRALLMDHDVTFLRKLCPNRIDDASLLLMAHLTSVAVRPPIVIDRSR